VDASGHDFDLGPAEFAVEGVRLAVHVADADVIEVNQRQGADARAGERFDGPRTNAADSDHADVCPTQPLQTGRAKQSAHTTEPLFVIIHSNL
jgi:hypothetical protein